MIWEYAALFLYGMKLGAAGLVLIGLYALLHWSFEESVK